MVRLSPRRRKQVPPKPGALRVRRRARKREEILKAGLKVFAEKGYHGATMDDIALELEATKGLLYYHFRTKEEILNALLSGNELIAGLEAAMLVREDAPLAHALRDAVHRSLALMEANGELVRFLHVQALLSGRQAELVYTKVLDRFYEGAARWVEAFKRTGEVKAEVDAQAWGRLLVDFITNHFLQRQIFGERAQPAPEYIDSVLRVVLEGIATGRPATVSKGDASPKESEHGSGT